MTPPKSAEMPRGVFTRLAAPRTSVPPPRPSLLSAKRQPSQQRITPSRSLCTSAVSPYSSISFSAATRGTTVTSTILRPTAAPTTATTKSSSAESSINPIRHNGTYVAAFKPARRAFHATAARQRDHHFDTLKFVKRLKEEGFSEEQAAAMMRILNDVIQESIQNLTRTMVLKEG